MDFELVCFCDAAKRLARRLSALYDDNLKSCGLNAGQFAILSQIAMREPVSVSTLAKAVDLEQSTMTRNLASLKSIGAILMSSDKGDARVKTIRLSKKGKDLVAEGDPLWKKSQQQARKLMTKAFANELLGVSIEQRTDGIESDN